MKESIGGTALFNIVIFFVLLFTGYICISINYTKAFNVANEVVNIIENQGGICTGNDGICYNFKMQIQDYFGDVTYHSRGKCDDGWIGFDRQGEIVSSGENASFCVRGIKTLETTEIDSEVYYQVKLFYQLDLPIINKIFSLSVDGTTSLIYSPNECDGSVIYNWC